MPTQEADCLNPLITAIVQISAMLVIAHLFHLVFKPLGIPGPISQILAGLVLSPTLLSRINKVSQFFLQDASAAYYRAFAFVSRTLFVFLIGLQTDIPYMRLNFRLASTIALGGMIMSIVLGGLTSFYLVREFEVDSNKPTFFIVIMIIFASSASPIVTRLISDLKFDTSELGRLAMACSLIVETSCVVGYSVFLAFSSWGFFGKAIGIVLLTGALYFANKYMAQWFSTWNKNAKYVSNAHVLLILVLLLGVTVIIESTGYHSTFTSFLLGVMFPRKGKTTRTLFKKLTYSINDFILPIYFGYMGFQFDASDVNSLKRFLVLMLIVLLSFGSKIIGTLAICHYLRFPRIQAVLLSFILNLKGNFELLLIDVERSQATWWNQRVHNVYLIVIVLSTLISGPIITYIMRRKEKFFAHKNTSIEYLDPDQTEFRMVACAYDPRHAAGQLVLIAALSGTTSAYSPYLMHLVELPKRRQKTTLMYNQLEDGNQFSDEEDYGGNDVLEINDAVDAFSFQSNIKVYQIKVVNSFANMYEDVCTNAEDLRVSMIFLHFHKHQRIDKNLENGKEGYRTTNQKILRHAPCSVGIFVHKIQTGFQQPVGYEKVQHVGVLFFGGPDDREALACSKRIVANSNIKLTVIRFLPTDSSSKIQSSESTRNNDDILMSLTRNEAEHAKDHAFIEDFHHRYVNTGLVGYIEKYVNNGLETVSALKDIIDMEYSLFIVGKGGRGRLPMTTGMSDWEECPELGTVGDLLASTDFDLKSSILVIQQHRHHSEKDLEES